MKEFLKNLKNFRWEVRYKNLEKKYNELQQELEVAKKKLEDDYTNKLIRDKDKMIKRQREIIENLRNDYKELSASRGE